VLLLLLPPPALRRVCFRKFSMEEWNETRRVGDMSGVLALLRPAGGFKTSARGMLAEGV